MIDIVERLRTYDPDVDSPDVVSEAADEIERLRRMYAIAQAAMQEIADQVGVTLRPVSP